ncbi:TIM barrel protein [Gordonia polyisoprenivorans]|uniref:sugar phosphate isomerase/epimerase family protein n=1 Tax=Gordonia polyisoprenivorans TaxID=84595 RepID=UPI001A0B2C9F|nr:sugar phosphate isomerase/epimerase [Gordonia polyisoprenivorans]MBE7191121.1 TIM barrel protein [Gordonia polyisoprenivorans]QUD83587.1 TIM barrel protein [Gordonia polyisoprenivorans]UZF55451.1 sugar phosphate isomerase/epimerase [Gordonia polyisoprenivorans]
MTLDMKWSTDLVTYFAPQRWGLPADVGHLTFERAVNEDPRRYFDVMLDNAAAAGLSGIELAPAPGGWVNALRAYGSAANFKAALNSRGLVLSSSYALPVRLKAALDAPDEAIRRTAEHALWEESAAHAEFLRIVGCPTLVTSTVPRAAFSDVEGVPAPATDFGAPADPDLLDASAELLNGIGAVAADTGVHVAVHTDAYSLASRKPDVDVLMSLTNPATVKLCIDAGHIALDGGDPLAILRAHSDRAPILHWKDCATHLPPHTLSGPPMVRHDVMITYFRVMGSVDGSVDWHGWVDILTENRWQGWSVAEIDMSADPQREIRQGIDYYTTTLAPTADSVS